MLTIELAKIKLIGLIRCIGVFSFTAFHTKGSPRLLCVWGGGVWLSVMAMGFTNSSVAANGN